jgi:hypothetical protein
MATAPGAGPGMFRGALNWLTGAPSVPEVSSIIAGGSPYGMSPVGVPGLLERRAARPFALCLGTLRPVAFPAFSNFPMAFLCRSRALPISVLTIRRRRERRPLVRHLAINPAALPGRSTHGQP